MEIPVVLAVRKVTHHQAQQGCHLQQAGLPWWRSKLLCAVVTMAHTAGLFSACQSEWAGVTSLQCCTQLVTSL